MIHAPHGKEPLLLETPGGPPIGFFQLAEGLFGPYEETQLLLVPGDRLYLYSDGVVEATDKHRNLYGAAQLLEQVKKSNSMSLQESVDFLAETVDHWCGEGKSPQDDVSILALEISSS